MQLTLKAHFNKQIKDSKKEQVVFWVKGEDEKKPEISKLTREVVELEIEGVDQKLTCEFNKTTKDSKKTVLEFIVKGDTSSDQSFNFYRKAGSDVTLTIVESQMDIDDFNEEQREGIKYNVGKEGVANVDQVTIDQIASENEEIEEEEKEDSESDELI
ncbi:hypothetical protein [Metabacillus halosaccharovorans]|uniref:hypothetical protein n=1 Tax=Metabacillus halosaccharovorans TaxID=930124 RepID=UPI0009957CD7|nr:hypothetical protein [Metabacillus halosaccharovorans]